MLAEYYQLGDLLPGSPTKATRASSWMEQQLGKLAAATGAGATA